jgi:hypothetical protein
MSPPIGDDVAEIDPDPKGNTLVFGHLRAAVRHRALDLDGAAHGIDDARKLHQHAVAGGLDDATVMLPDFRVDEFATMRLQPIDGTFLIGSHQPRITRHIGGQDGRKPARRGRSYGLTRSSLVIGDAAVDECAPLGHLSASPVRGTRRNQP